MTEYILIITLILSAFFSGIEIAFFSANKLKFELANSEGKIHGKILSKFSESPSHFLGTTLLGNNIALVVFNIMATKLFEPILIKNFEALAANNLLLLLVQTLIFTILILITGEFLPKAFFRMNPNGYTKFFAVPINIFYTIFKPFVLGIVWIANFIIRKIFRVDFEENKPVFNNVDLMSFVNLSQINSDEETEIDTQLFERALYLSQIKTRECMVPRTEIEAIDISRSIDDLKKSIIESKHSKILVYEETIDTVLGYIHHYDLWKNPKNLRSMIIPINTIPETLPAQNLLYEFIQQRKSIARVVDEFGGTAGIITLEDILEEIFGEIQDEHDVDEFVEQQLSNNEYIFSARIEIDYINEKYELNIPEGEYETLGGFIMSETENIPNNNELIEIAPFSCLILLASDHKIETVKLIVPDSNGDD